MRVPEKNYIHFWRNEGKFNLLDSRDVSAQYVFEFPGLSRAKLAEMGLRKSYLIAIEKDNEYDPDSYTALELAREIEYIHSRYLYSGYMKEIKKLVEYLESVEEEQKRLKLDFDIEYANYQIKHWSSELESLLLEKEETQ